MIGSYLKIILTLTFFSWLTVSCSRVDREPVYKIGFSQAMTSDNWRREMNKSMIIETSLNPDLILKISDAKNNVQKQIEDINALIAADVDILIVSPIQSLPITASIERAMDAGIPTIIIDRKIEGNKYTAYVGADNNEIGKNAAKYIISNSKDIKTQNILEIQGMEGSSPAQERSFGFKEVLTASGIKQINFIRGNWEKSSIKEELNRFFDSHEKVDFIFAHNDRMAQGAIEVAKERGLEDQIKFIGVDGLFGPTEGIQMVKDGALAATILYPTGGSEAIKLARDLIKDEIVSKNNILKTVVIDSVNVDLMQNQFNKLNQQQNDIERQQQIIKNQMITSSDQRNFIQIMVVLLITIIIFTSYTIYLILKIRRGKKRLEIKNKKISIQRNQIERFAKRLKVNNDSKLNLYYSLYQEFKEPITLITNSIYSIIKSKASGTGNLGYDYAVLISNSKRLLRLNNEIFDLGRLETGSFQLRVSKTNIYDFLEGVFNDFKEESISKSITYKLDTFSKDKVLYIDRNMMDNVFFHLLSNAFKSTPQNGEIQVKIEEDDPAGMVNIYIKDSGIQFSQNMASHVFDSNRHQADGLNTRSTVGLFLVREFTNLHMGNVSLKVNKGVEFCISLHQGKEFITNLDICITNSNNEKKELQEQTHEVESLECNSNESNDMPLILIVEENLSLARILKKNLKDHFRIVHALGEGAIERATTSIPAIIILDLDLNDYDAGNLCTTLKNDLRTSHIPVIALSLQNDFETEIQALQAGTDYFISKPFNVDILRYAIENVSANREKLRYYYANKIGEVEHDKLSWSEQKFLKQLNSIITENLSEQDFNVEDLSQQMKISRVQLYRKVKSLMGTTVSEYVNDKRLAKGRELLQNSDLNISEIAYGVGYSSPGYFSTSFKNKYSVSPKKFRSTKTLLSGAH